MDAGHCNLSTLVLFGKIDLKVEGESPPQAQCPMEGPPELVSTQAADGLVQLSIQRERIQTVKTILKSLVKREFQTRFCESLSASAEPRVKFPWVTRLAGRCYFNLTTLPFLADNLAASSISITIILFSSEERSYLVKEISLLMTAARNANGSL